jgi:branched-chain amino acid aminotransferase
MNRKSKIWMDGKLVEWDNAKIHILTHALHYGTAVFEGIRCYNTKNGPAIFRLEDHIKRLFNSCKMYHMTLEYSDKELREALTYSCKGYRKLCKFSFSKNRSNKVWG